MGKQVDSISGRDPSLGRRISGGNHQWETSDMIYGLKNNPTKFTICKGIYVGKRPSSLRKHASYIAFMLALVGLFLNLDTFVLYIFNPIHLQSSKTPKETSMSKVGRGYNDEQKSPIQMHDRLLHIASRALLEIDLRQDPSNFWEEPSQQRSFWKPCADRRIPLKFGKSGDNNSYIMVSASGGLNQQRVAICNAVAVASLLNATLVIPKFLYSNVWKDPSQFGDIYQEEFFINKLKNEVTIVKELPPHLKSLDIEAIGSLITDADITKEARPNEYIEKVLPLLLKNGVVHFLGFGNRLGFDPLSSRLQRLRCKCNFHALKFVPNIQQVGSLLIKRIRKYDLVQSSLDKQLLGNFMSNVPLERREATKGPLRYLSLHLRFEVDMVAYSMCEFGGGQYEKKELQTYREIHFPLLIERLKNSEPVSAAHLRKSGKCPLTPEEAALVLSALGFKSKTYIYLAGSHIYGGKYRMQPFTSLYPNLVTKEDLLTPTELEAFRNFSSQLAALDFLACASADVFAITDSGSQLSNLVSGFRTYFGDGHAPTLRPNKKRLAAILSDNSTIEWDSFKDRIKKMIEEGQRVRARGFGRSIYRQPKCPDCMCKSY